MALAREFVEETGARVRVGRLLLATEGVFRTRERRHHEVNLVFHVEHLTDRHGGAVRSREAKIAFQWCPLAGIRRIDLRPETIRKWLAENAQPVGRVGPAPWRSGFA